MLVIVFFIFDELKVGCLMIQYSLMVEMDVVENLLCFMWIFVIDDDVCYVFCVLIDLKFQKGKMCVYENLFLNFFIFDMVFEVGDYFWFYVMWDVDKGVLISQWSILCCFIVVEGLVEMLLLLCDVWLVKVVKDYLCLWMINDCFFDFIKVVKVDLDYCIWFIFYEKLVLLWMDCEVMKEFVGYFNDQCVVIIWW